MPTPGLLPEVKVDHLRTDLPFLLICTIVLIAFYLPAILGSATYYAADHGFYFEPLCNFIAAAWRHGHMALWNPYVHCGMPELAIPSPGIFYIPNLLFVVMPYGKALAWLLLFHQLMTGYGFYLLISSFRWEKGSAVCAGLIAAYCGYMFSIANNYTLVATIAWLPMCLYLMRKIRLAKDWHHVLLPIVLEALAFAAMITAGRPELSVPGGVIVLVFSLIQSFGIKDQSDQTKNRFNFGWQILALIMGTLISAPVILPVVEWLINSPRAKGIGAHYALMWSANWYDFLTMIFPPPYGDLRVLGSPYLNLVASRAGHLPLVPSTFVGPVALTLAVIGIVGKGFPGRNWLIFLMVSTLIMASGDSSWVVSKLMDTIPYATIFRYPIKLLIIAVFCLAIFAAWGLHKLITKEVSTDTLQAMFPLWIAGCISGLCISLLGIFDKKAVLPSQILLGQSFLVGSLAGLATLALARLVTVRGDDSKRVTTALLVFLLFSLLMPSLYLRPNQDSIDFYTHRPYLLSQLERLPQPKLAAKDQPRILRLYFDPLKLPDKYIWGDGDSINANYFQYCRDLLLPNTNVDFHQPTTYGYEAAETGDLRTIMLSAINKSQPNIIDDPHHQSVPSDKCLWRMCRASASYWVVSQIHNDEGPVRKLEEQYFELLAEKPEMNVRIYRTTQPLPRTFLSTGWHWSQSHKDVVDSTENEDSNFDPQSTTLIEPLADKSTRYFVLAPPAVNAASKLPANAVYTQEGILVPALAESGKQLQLEPPTFLVNKPEHVSIEVQVPKDTFLVLADQYYPGWIAHIDSVLAPIYRANGVFKAVYLSKGAHLVEFDYDPDSLKTGLWCAALAAIVIGCLLLLTTWPWLWRKVKQTAGEA